MLAVRYSIRPCPKGCSLSGALLARRVPTMVMTEDRASVRLFTASRVMEMELERSPTPALKPAKNRLARIPMILVCTMTFSLLLFIKLLYAMFLQNSFRFLSTVFCRNLPSLCYLISKRCFSEALPPVCQKACL